MKKKTKPSLAKANRPLAREWHPTKNTPLTPRDVTPGSSKKVWWLCKKGHEWETYVKCRSKGYGCPYCSGRYPTDSNNLEAVNPQLAKQWHPIKNAPLTPRDVKSCSRKKVWWKCSKGHEWEAVISDRGRNGCPYCSGRRVSKDNCLQVVKPRLAREWHPVKNAPLTPKTVTTSYFRKVWWICRKGHEWEMTIYNRSEGQGCPYCSGRRVCKENCLQTINPLLAREWHPTRNIPLTPRDVTHGSAKKVWWMCEKHHEWEAEIASRNSGVGCPYCSGRAAAEDNCLQTINPKLACEWHPTRNRPLTPKNVTAFSNRQVWWKCPKGHQWEAVIGERSRSRAECPYCSRQRASKEYCLQSINPGLAREWHTTKNGLLTPNDVTPFSAKKVWWKCRRGHEWKAVINNRNRESLGCPYCSGYRATKETCLQTVSPRLAKEWHPTKNAALTPKEIAPFSSRLVWWKCRKGHEAQERVIDRYKRGGCPVCTLKAKVPWLFEAT